MLRRPILQCTNIVYHKSTEPLCPTNSCDSTAGQCSAAKLRCLPGYTCTIYCGHDACADARISGNDATHVDLLCEGNGACTTGKYYCGSGDCTLQCTNSGDCTNIRVLTTGKAHSWQCSGFCPSTLPANKMAVPAPTAYLQNGALPTV